MTYPDLPPNKSVLLEMLVERRSSKELRRIWCRAGEVRGLLKSTLGRNDELLGWLVTPLEYDQ
ncbi:MULTISPECIES: hypothetical protein [Vibrio]|uniref:hypothetical protein n=1 Tax=Vibrio TaxID=662 RepID=UPI000C86B219|nr:MULTISPECIES: hypothetical protein [Vibrio]EHK0753622.1 hypothetical protein [Vibrio parahaemolyticus]EHR5480195.1 hypothetical protein [Vibrio parahaemolyticus]ELB2953271.1 hypothetical protein [Vibrio parahaemolyticus]MBY4650565.1 hypothetical protein [Vibrio parahaemolyticus]MCC3798796.1 hypothetical protein [Vibrio parahaemolyticus]